MAALTRVISEVTGTIDTPKRNPVGIRLGGPFYSAEHNDAASDLFTHEHTTDCTLVNTAGRVQTGSRSVFFPMATNAAKCTLNAATSEMASTNGRTCSYFFGAFGVSGDPSSAIGLLSAEPQGGRRYVRIGTDRKIRFYDKNGNQVGRTSNSTVSSSGLTDIGIIFEDTTLTSPKSGGQFSSLWIYLFIDGVQDVAFDTGLEWLSFYATGDIFHWGEYLPADTNRGVNLYGDDIGYWAPITAGDNYNFVTPSQQHYPRLRGVGGAANPPTAAGTYVEYIESTGTGANSFQLVDDNPHNSGTDYIQAGDFNLRHTFRWSAANPLPGGNVNIQAVITKCVDRLVGSKLPGHGFIRFNGIDAGNFSEEGSLIATQTSTYGGTHHSPFRFKPGGGFWQKTDFDLDVDSFSKLQFGVKSYPNIGPAVTHEVTSMMGPDIVYYNSVLPLATAPYLVRFGSEPIGLYENRSRLSTILRSISEVVKILETGGNLYTQFLWKVAEVEGIVETSVRTLAQGVGQALVRVLAEIEAIIETSRALQALTRSKSEVEGIVETPTRAGFLIRIKNNVISVIENAFKRNALARRIAEVVAIIETARKNLSLTRNIAEIELIIEESRHIASLTRKITEIVAIIENSKASLVLNRQIAEIEAIVENGLQRLSLTRIKTEIEAIIENGTYFKSINRFVSETVAIIENTLKFGYLTRRIAETELIVETTPRAESLKRRIAEVIAIIENSQRNISLRRQISEVVAIIENITKTVSFRRIINEAESIVENGFRFISGSLFKLINEIESIVETSQRNVSYIRHINESELIIESIKRLGSLNRQISEIEAIVEVRQRLGALTRRVAEVEAIIESAFSKTPFVRLISEVVAIIESASTNFTLRRAINEIVAVLEVPLRSLALRRAVSEIEGIVENIRRLSALSRRISEIEAIAEILDTQRFILKIVSEIEAIIEQTNRTLTFIRQITEIEAIIERITTSARYLRIIGEAEGIYEQIFRNSIGFVRIINELVIILEAPQRVMQPYILRNVVINIIRPSKAILANRSYSIGIRRTAKEIVSFQMAIFRISRAITRLNITE